MTDEVVTRLYSAIVNAVRRRGSPEGPVKVADLYQEIVPYSAVRSALGVELNADYEHALLRLLAGERDLLRVEPGAAREELRKEAAAAYPNVDAYRKFSGSDVWITLPDISYDPDGATPAASIETASTGPVLEPESAVEPESALEPGSATEPELAVESGSAAESGSAVEVDAGSEAPVDESPTAACTACGHELPTDREVRYCPACGVDQRVRPCPECGELLEADWRFCIACGLELIH